MLNRWCILLIFCFSLALAIPVAAVVPAPTLVWNATFGGGSYDSPCAIQQTADGGLVVAGYTASSETGDVGRTNGSNDYWVVKLDGAGQKVWNTTLGGTGSDVAYAMAQTSDGGYVVAGKTGSHQTGDVGLNHGNMDYWIVKLDGTGQKVWNSTLGGSLEDCATAVQQTADGGYIVAGYTSSSESGDVGLNHGNSDYWVVKLDGAGQMVWNRTLGGTGFDDARAVAQTSDGGFVVAGMTTSSESGDVGLNHGAMDFWVVKLDGTGQKVWNTTLGGSHDEYAYAVTETSDGGFVVAGHTGSDQTGDVGRNHGMNDFWVVKLDGGGQKVWNSTLGGSHDEYAYAVQQTADGGYVVAGYTASSESDDVGLNHGGMDYWIVKLDGTGQKVWTTTLGGTGLDLASAVQETTDGGYVVGGHTGSNDQDIGAGRNHGGWDYWICRLDSSILPTPTPTPSGPSGSFAAYPQSGPAPHQVQFLDYTPNAKSWSWEFGDGGSSTLQYPTHQYNQSGLYTVSVTVTDWSDRTETKTQYHLIRVSDPVTPAPTPAANFSANATAGPAPLTVAFTDASSPAPYHRWWQFGDGTSSTDTNPVHTFAKQGTYTVNLTAWTAIGTASTSKSAYITVGADPRAPVANFTMSRSSGTVPFIVRLTDTSTGNPTSWRWEIPNRGWTTARNPTVYFYKSGTYAVILTATNEYGSSQMTKNVTATFGRTKSTKGDAVGFIG